MNHPTTPISAVAEALEAATPGPWHANVAAIDDWGAWVEVVDDPYPDGSPRPLCDGINRAADAHLIANAPTWLAQLLAAVGEAQQENARLREALRSIAQYDPRWTGQHVNDMPSRAKLIAQAFDSTALAPSAGEADE